MNPLAYHRVEVALGDQTHTLDCTPAAALAIADRFGGVTPALEALRALNLRAVANIIRAGANLTEARSKDLEAAVYAAGLPQVVPACVEFLGALLRGGQPLPKPGEDLEKEQPQGNA